MLEALRKVALLDFVMEQGGLDMELQEQGNNLSGGQKQRLSIARMRPQAISMQRVRTLLFPLFISWQKQKW